MIAKGFAARPVEPQMTQKTQRIAKAGKAKAGESCKRQEKKAKDFFTTDND
jgi:hypothetical protein